jgi:hypothetical protein
MRPVVVRSEQYAYILNGRKDKNQCGAEHTDRKERFQESDQQNNWPVHPNSLAGSLANFQ